MTSSSATSGSSSVATHSESSGFSSQEDLIELAVEIRLKQFRPLHLAARRLWNPRNRDHSVDLKPRLLTDNVPYLIQ